MKCLVLVVALAGVAHADELDTSVYLPDARPHVKAAYDAYVAQDYDTSVREWEAAWSLDRNPQLLYSWAQAERMAKRCGLAIKHYREYLTWKVTDNQQLAARGAISLCLEEIKKTSCEAGVASPTTTTVTATQTPWYKNPISGAVLVGGIGVTVGIGFLIAASGAHDRAREATTLGDFTSALDDATVDRRIGLTTMILGAALGAGAVIYHYKFRASPSGVAVEGTF